MTGSGIPKTIMTLDGPVPLKSLKTQEEATPSEETEVAVDLPLTDLDIMAVMLLKDHIGVSPSFIEPQVRAAYAYAKTMMVVRKDYIVPMPEKEEDGG